MGPVFNQVSFKLLDADEMQAVLDVIAEDNPEVMIVREPGGYFELDAPKEILVDLERISARLGRPFEAPEFMRRIVSFYGRVSAEDMTFFLTDDLLTVADYDRR